MKTTTPLVKIAILVIIAISSIKLQAQEKCGYDMAHDYFMSTDVAYSKNNKETEERIKEFITNKSQKQMATGVLDIPVVVHIVNIGEPLGTGSNIPDAQIIGAIQGMNDKYKSLNGFGVDMLINFCLAVRDPNGNATSGINRVDGSAVTNYINSGMYAIANVSPASCFNNYAAIKDLSKWPTQNYLNIWVVYKYCLSAGLNLYGQATGQTGGAYDGVTILYTQMTQSSITLAHEVGHMLLLNHTFQGDGGGGTCPVDTSCANNGDLVCDTPPHKTNDWGATNPCTATGIWDNSRYNYMGYAWAAGPTATFNETTCRFTQGQKDRARAAIFALTTENYLNSNACTPPSAVDAGIKIFSYPISSTYTTNCSFPNMLSPIVQLKNYGMNPLTSATINYKADNNSFSSYSWTGNLLKDSSAYVTLPGIAVSQGAHTFIAYTTNPNGVTDTYNSNDSANTTITYTLNQTSDLSLTSTGVDPTCSAGNNGSASVSAVSSASKFIVTENFEGSTDWTIVNGSEINHWIIGSATANGGNKAIYITTDNLTNSYQLNTSSSVHLYKDFYFPVGATNIKIKFDYKCNGEGGGFNGVDRIRVYLLPTTTFPQAGYQLGASPFVALSIGSYYTQATFKTDSITGLDANAGLIKRIDFNWRNNASGGVQSPAAIDNIIVSYDLPAISTYSYSWNAAPTQNTATASALPAGTYNVIVTDANNCTNTTSVVLNQPAAYTALITANNPTTFCLGDSVTLTSSAANSYSWSNGAITQSTVIKTSGSYFVNPTNANGCIGVSNIISVTVNPAGNCAAGVVENNDITELNIFPNPASEYLTIEGGVKENGTHNLMIVNEIGQALVNEQFSIKNNFMLKTISIKELPVGIYFIQLTSEKNRLVKKITKE
jgi:hypothetical protein